MSCVLGLLQNGKLYLGSDGLATTEDGERRPVICVKIFTNKGYLIGYTGSVRHGQLLFPRCFDPPASIYDFPEAVRKTFEEHGAMLSSDAGQQMHSSNMLIGHKGRLWELLIDFQMNEVMGDFTGIGSGSTYAMGSLFSTKKWGSPMKRIMTALEAASEYDRSVGAPYAIKVME